MRFRISPKSSGRLEAFVASPIGCGGSDIGIALMRPLFIGDHDEVFDTLMYLRDGIQDENTKLMGLNDAIAEAEEKISMKKEHVKTMKAASDDV
ncbi:hypothetical protein Tco_0650799 [Tanacetum coccineum]